MDWIVDCEVDDIWSDSDISDGILGEGMTEGMAEGMGEKVVSEKIVEKVDEKIVVLVQMYLCSVCYRTSISGDNMMLFNRLKSYFEEHDVIRSIMHHVKPLHTNLIDTDFGKKFANYIMWKIRAVGAGSGYNLSGDEILIECGLFIKYVMVLGWKIPPYDEDMVMLDAYPIQLLSKVCDTSPSIVYHFSERMKRLICVRKYNKIRLPTRLNNVASGYVTLTGNDRSPLNVHELDAIFRYLGTKKRLYVNLLLNMLHEYKYHNIYLESPFIEEAQIKDICKSAWLCFYLFVVARSHY